MYSVAKKGPMQSSNAGRKKKAEPTEAEECASLDLALQRLSLLEDSKLERTLQRLLPMVIEQLQSRNQLTREKTVKLLTHVNKRTEGLVGIEFPLEELVLCVVRSEEECVLVRTFGMMYVAKAFERTKMGYRKKRELVETLMRESKRFDEKTRSDCFRICVDVIGEEFVMERWNEGGIEWIGDGETRMRFLRHCLAVAQYQPNAIGNRERESVDVRVAREQAFLSGIARLAGNVSPSNATNAAAAANANANDEETVAGPGLSQSLLKEILGDVWVSDKEARQKAKESSSTLSASNRWRMGDLKALAERKKAILEFLAEVAVFENSNNNNNAKVEENVKVVLGGESYDEEAVEAMETDTKNNEEHIIPTTSKRFLVTAEELFPIALAVACDASETCRSYGETILKKRCSIDGARPDLDSENETFISHQLRWFLGDSSDVPTESRVYPANDEIRANILRRVLSRSQRSANLFPHNVDVVSSALNNPRSKQLRASGMEFSAWILRNADKVVLKKAAPKLLETCLLTLDSLETSSSAPTQATQMSASERVRALELKGFCFQSLGHLIERAPELIKSAPGMMLENSRNSIDAVDFLKRILSEIENEYDSHTRSSIVECGRALLRACEGDSIVHEGEKLAMEYVVSEILDKYANTVFTSDGGSDLMGGDAPSPGAKSALLLALRFAGNEECFRFDSVAVRFGCVLNCARPELDIRDAARKALVLKTKRVPCVSRILDRVVLKCPLLSKDPQRDDGQPPLPEKSMFALLRFLRQCRRFHEIKETESDDACSSLSYRRYLKHCLLRTSGSGLASLALVELQDVLSAAKKSNMNHGESDDYQYYLRAAKFFSASDDSVVRKAAAGLLGTMVKLDAFSDNDIEALVVSFLETASRAVGLGENESAASSNLRAELADGALRSLAALIATTSKEKKNVAKFFPAERYEKAKVIFQKALLNVPRTDATSKDVLLGIAGCECLGSIFATSESLPILSENDISALSQVMDRALAAPKVAAAAALSAGYALRRNQQSAIVSSSLDSVMKPLVDKLFTLLTIKRDEVRFSLSDAIKLIFYGEKDLVLSTDLLTEDGGSYTFVRIIDREVEELLNENIPEATTTSNAMDTDNQITEDVLLSSSDVDVSQDDSRNPLRELILEYLFDDDGKDGESSKVGYLFNSRDEIRCGATAILCALVNPLISTASVISDAFDGSDDSSSSKNGTRVNKIALLESRFDDAQESLLAALGDTNAMTQEMASSGLSSLYDRGDEVNREKLLENLTKALSGEASNKGKKRAMSKVDDDTVIFQDGIRLDGDKALKEKAKGNGQSSDENSMLSTYKELCSVVSDIGQPDLMYKFMEISNHQKKVNRAASAGAGIARIAKKAGVSLSAHSEQLAPRLYRLRKDVNSNMRETAEAAWQTLVAAEKEKESSDSTDAKMVVASDLSVKMFDQICERLLLDCSSREWRVRQSASEALAELFSSGGAGKTFDIVENKLAEAWTIAFRVADDIKETVRVKGMMFVKTLRSLSLRLTDANQIGDSTSTLRETKREIAKKACILILPQLFEKGLKSDSPVAREVSLFVACEILKKAPAEALNPHCVVAIEALLEALSTFEDTRLNYYEQRVTAMFGNDTDANGKGSSVVENFQKARVQASSNSIVSDALDAFIQHVDLEETKALAPVFTNIFKKGLGLNTKVGAGRFVVRLCARRPDAVKGFFAGKMCEALLASPDVLNGVSSGGASSKIIFRQYCQTFATCLRFATLKRQEKTISDVLKLANDDSSDSSKREAAAEIISEMAKDSRGVECLKDFEDDLLPLAYFGMFDENETVAKCWENAWEELSGGASAIGKNFPKLWKSFLKPHLEGSNYSLKSRSARTISAAMKNSSFSTSVLKSNESIESNNGKEILMREMLETLSNELRSNRSFQGKNDLAIALGDVLKSVVSLAMHDVTDNREACFEALNRLTKCTESKDINFASSSIEALKNILEQLMASSNEVGNIAPFVKSEKFIEFIRTIVSSLAHRVSENVKIEAAAAGENDEDDDNNKMDVDNMMNNDKEAEAERFAKNKSKTTFIEKGMECFAVLSNFDGCSSLDVQNVLDTIAIEHAPIGMPWQTRISAFKLFQGIFSRQLLHLENEFLRVADETLKEVGNAAPAALRVEATKSIGALLKATKSKKEACELLLKLAVADRSPEVRNLATSILSHP